MFDPLVGEWVYICSMSSRTEQQSEEKRREERRREGGAEPE